MKKEFLLGLILIGMLTTGRAATYYQGTPVDGGIAAGSLANSTIYDGNPARLTVNTIDLSSYSLGIISSMKVTLNVFGGQNNGLYAYLVGPGPSGSTAVILMNQPGVLANDVGAIGAGIDITLQDGTVDNGSIQNEVGSGSLIGTYNASGSLMDFSAGNPNGTWTLYFSDTIAGGGNAVLNGWSLEIAAVPEPASTALVLFGGVLVFWSVNRKRFKSTISPKKFN